MAWFDLPSGFRPRRPATRAQRFAAVHGRWLERALSRPDTDDLRVPARRVADGGFEALLARPRGRQRCEQWWFDTFAYLDAIAL